MAGAISEVRAKFGASAKGFQDTIRQMRSDIQNFGKKADDGFTNANKSVKTFDGSIRGIQMQMRSLGRAGQLKSLTDAMTQAKNEAKTFGTVTTETAQRLSREMAKAKSEISKMGGVGADQLKNLENHIKSAETAMKDMGGTVTTTYDGAAKMAHKASTATSNFRKTFLSWTSAAVGVSAMVTGMGGLVTVTSDYQTALNNLRNSTGATDKETKSLGQSMQNIYAQNYGADFQDIADSMAAVQKATGDTGKALENTTKYAIKLRDTFQMDVTESAATASTMMKQFGITSKEAYTLIAQGAQQGLDKNGDMLDSFNEYSVYFKQLGFDAEGMWNTFKAGSSAGAFNMDKVGDAIKEFGIRVKDGSKTTATGFKQIGLDANDMAQQFAKGGDSAQNALTMTFKKLSEIEDPVKRNAAGVALFGTQFEDLEFKTIKAMGSVRNEANMTGKTLDNMNSVKYTSVGAAITGIGRSLLVEVINPMQTKVMPTINKLVEGFTANMPTIKAAISSAFGTMSKLFTSVAPTISNLFGILQNLASAILPPIGLAFGAISLAIAPLLNYITGMIKAFTGLEGFAPIVGGLVAAFVTYQATLKMVTAAQKIWAVLSRAQIILTNAWRAAVLLFNSAWLANPIGLVVAALVGLGVALYMAYQKSETFRNIVNAVWESLKNGFNAAVNWISTTLPQWWNNIVSFFSNSWTWIKGFFSKWGIEILAVIAPFIGIPLLIAKHWDTIKAFFSNLWTTVSGAVMGFVNGIVTWFQNLGSKIGSVVSSMWATVVGLFNNFVSNMQFILSPLISFFTNTWNNIKLAVLGIIGVFTSLIVGDFEGVKLGLLAIWTAIKNQVMNVINTFKTIALRAFTVFKSGVTNIWNGIKSVTLSIWNALKSVVINAANGLKTGALNAWNALKLGVINAANALKNGAINAWNALKSGAINAVNALKSGAINAFNNLKSSASSIINNVKSAIVNGFNSAKTSAVSAVTNLYNSVRTWLSKIPQKAAEIVSQFKAKFTGINLSSIGSNIISGLVNGISSGASAVYRKAQEIASGIKNKIKSALGIHSPSREMIKLMAFVHDGLRKGLHDGKGKTGKKAAEIANTIFTAMKDRINHTVKLNKISLAEEAALWRETAKLTNVGTNNRNYAIEKAHAAEVKLQKAREEAAKKHAAEMAKKYADESAKIKANAEQNKYTMTQEAEAWDNLAKKFKSGTKERISAETEAYKVKQEINKKLTDINNDYLKNVQDTNAKLIADTKAMSDEYVKAVEDRAKALKSGIFDEVKAAEDTKTGQEYLDNLKAQVSQLQEWTAAMEALKTKGLSQGIIDELLQMGASGLDKVKALIGMTDAQLQEFNKTYIQRDELARNQAKSELDIMRIDTEKGIKALEDQAKKDLDGYKSTWISAIKEISQGAKTELSSTKLTMTQIGKDSISGLINGMKSMTDPLKSTASIIAQEIEKTIKSTLKIKSPSRILKALGVFAGRGLDDGLASMIRAVRNTASNMANAVTDGIDMNGAISGGLNAEANLKSTAIIRHVLDLVNVPANIDQETLTRMLLQAFTNPTVQTALDRANDAAFTRTIRPKGKRG